jgi:hypothetical protein
MTGWAAERVLLRGGHLRLILYEEIGQSIAICFGR